VHALLGGARAKLHAASVLLAAGAHGDAASRAYYAAFHAVSALLLDSDKAYSSHAQVLGAFNRDFVHAGAFPREFSAILVRLFEDRQTGDYDPTTEITPAEAAADVSDAARIVEAVEQHLNR
jgi:uncharacterized protein (UPF0332 family)